MSLISLATRVVLGRMLEGRTWAENRIFDSPLDPIAEVMSRLERQPKPCIAVYTQEAKGKPTGLETQGGAQALRMIVAVYLPPSKVDVPAGWSIEIDNTGSGLALNTMGRQIDAAMHFGNTDWIRVWRRFVTSIVEKTSRFVLVAIENGVRFPCLEVEYELNCVADAEFGKPLYGAWLALDAQLRAAGANTEDEKIADLIKVLIENPAELHDYELFQGNFALTDAAFASTGLDPLAADPETGDVPNLEGVDAPPEITVEGPATLP